MILIQNGVEHRTAHESLYSLWEVMKTAIVESLDSGLTRIPHTKYKLAHAITALYKLSMALVQDCGISMLEIPQSCSKPSFYSHCGGVFSDTMYPIQHAHSFVLFCL